MDEQMGGRRGRCSTALDSPTKGEVVSSHLRHFLRMSNPPTLFSLRKWNPAPPQKSFSPMQWREAARPYISRGGALRGVLNEKRPNWIAGQLRSARLFLTKIIVSEKNRSSLVETSLEKNCTFSEKFSEGVLYPFIWDSEALFGCSLNY